MYGSRVQTDYSVCFIVSFVVFVSGTRTEIMMFSREPWLTEQTYSSAHDSDFSHQSIFFYVYKHRYVLDISLRTDMKED